MKIPLLTVLLGVYIESVEKNVRARTHTHTHTHIYIYICVCVCVCVYVMGESHDILVNVQHYDIFVKAFELQLVHQVSD